MLIEVCVLGADYEIARAALADSPAFTVQCKSIVNASHATIATKGNSFGGVDGIVNTHLSSVIHRIQDFVKRKIIEEYAGELPVGTAIAISTLHPKHRTLIYAPTTRVPGPLPIDTLAPYLAFRAVLVAANRIGVDAISVPMFGTDEGEVSVRKACLQMQAALDSIDSIGSACADELTLAHRHHRMLLQLGT
jgi:O-acetyl-ADP-ribose deacetylase (regulator of RNase III)